MLRRLWLLAGCLLVGGLLSGVATAQDESLVEAEADVPEGVEVLTRGPIHEAFASPVTGDVEAGLVVAKEPPPDVEEVPPEFRPEGDDVIWIPGYWAWEEERDDFVWISGVWRRIPPRHRWVPGYWNKVDEGWQWTSGFWAPEAEEEVTYYDPPPETLEEGPTSDPPDKDYFWTPGCWHYYETGYRWRPGFWARAHTDWLWIPDRWTWTPTGAVFCPGFWDYQVSYRGSCFTPVYFERVVYSRPGFTWRPRFALNPAALVVNFWIRPNYCHYYFGNYYSNYDRFGYVPISHWWGRRRGWNWDPIVAYNQAYYRGRGIDYSHRLNQWHRFYVDNPNRRPPNTWRDQVNIIRQQNVTVNNINKITNVTNVINNDIDIVGRGGDANLISSNVVALPINQVARATRNADDTNFRFTQINERQREQAQARARQVREINQERARAEVRNTMARRDDRPDRRDPREARQRTSIRLPTADTPSGVARTGDREGREDRRPPERPDRRPGADRPGADRPGADRPDIGRRPDADRPGPDRPGADRPGRGQPDTRRDRTDDTPGRPTTRPGTDRPGPRVGERDRDDPTRVLRPDTDRPGADRPGADRPRTDRPGTDRSGDRRMIVDPPASEIRRDRPTTRPDSDRPRTERPGADRPRPDVDRPRPGGDRPGTDRPTPRPGGDRPNVDRPAARPEPRPEARRPEPRAERPEPRTSLRPETRPESRPTPRPEARPQPRPESRPQPRPEARPQPQPRPEARPQPRPQPQPRPEARPQPQPRPEARGGGGRPAGGDKGKGKGKERD